MTELSEHLRWLGRLVRADYETYCGRPADAKHACELAADRIEALEAECAQLRDKTIDLLNTGTEAMIALVKRAEVAEAACERLREAITEAERKAYAKGFADALDRAAQIAKAGIRAARRSQARDKSVAIGAEGAATAIHVRIRALIAEGQSHD